MNLTLCKYAGLTSFRCFHWASCIQTICSRTRKNQNLTAVRTAETLEEYLRDQFPDDKTVANRAALRRFNDDETQPTPATERQVADEQTVVRIAAENPKEIRLQGLRAVRQRDGLSAAPAVEGHTGRTGSSRALERDRATKAFRELINLLERTFRVHIILVESADGSPMNFHGFKDKRSSVILFDAHSNKPPVSYRSKRKAVRQSTNTTARESKKKS